MMRDYFPSSNIGAEIYGGALLNDFTFVKVYEFKDSLQDQLIEVNEFLLSNGYAQIEIDEVNEENRYERHPVYFGPHAYVDEIHLTIHRDFFAKTQSEFITKQLIEFRNERDWEQFHNPKDLAIALNIESGELLESFLWKSDQDADKEKVKEELADVFAYAFLLAEKYQFNIEEIVLNKIQKNSEKYPVEKAKGSAKKYDEL
jgi:NTP pyrophosphatase (non-canonical NTP hydrolase)